MTRLVRQISAGDEGDDNRSDLRPRLADDDKKRKNGTGGPGTAVITNNGATPVFVDIDPRTYNLDPLKLEAAFTPRTKAVVAVSLYGQCCDIPAIKAVCDRHQAFLIEDAAQSIGSSWNGSPIGSTGDLVSFSFHPNKNLTTIEGGCLVLNDAAEAVLAEQFRLQGVVRSGFDGMDVAIAGGKFNLTDVAARVGLGQLPHLKTFTRQRRELAMAYLEKFERCGARDLGLQLPLPDFEQSNWHMFQVILPEGPGRLKRAEVMEKLGKAGIGSGVHYPVIHLFTLYRGLGWKDGDFPHAEHAGRNILTLPLFPTMDPGDIDRVVNTLVTILQSSSMP